MSDLIQAGEFATLFKNQVPLLDVRAPVEFQRGAFPNAVNHPLLNDDERQAVGRRYREQGREAAIALGQELVSKDVKADRLRAWKDYVHDHPNCALYCFRGGMRSSIAQQWLAAEGVQVPRIAGGYKSLRRSLIDQLQRLAGDDNLVVIAGKTGSGKTHLLNSLPNSLDLEGFAHHRGSAFGRRAQGQPGQIDFENRLAIRLYDLSWQGTQRVVVEDESRAIGSLSVPLALHQRMCEAPIAMIEASLEQRINTIHLDYIQSNYADFQRLDPQQADQQFTASLVDALHRIRRRLGEESFARIESLLLDAIEQQLGNGNIEAHRLWISELLTSYYDPMYDYQLQKKSQRLVFRGNHDELCSWIKPLIEARS